jgi:hypothetical protein
MICKLSSLSWEVILMQTVTRLQGHMVVPATNRKRPIDSLRITPSIPFVKALVYQQRTVLFQLKGTRYGLQSSRCTNEAEAYLKTESTTTGIIHGPLFFQCLQRRHCH